ncbi:MAG: type II toxin-antitoxin system HicA family toxin [Chloroflexi bacterium]|nr:type II toxin-antitoxin system HicA family toxin [Chloroflexota bacterium]
MRRVPDLSHQRVVRALERAGFVVVRQGKHISMYSEQREVMAIIPRHNPVKRTTLNAILKEIGMSVEEFVEFL